MINLSFLDKTVIMPIIHIIKKNITKQPEILNITVPTTAEVFLTQTTHESQTVSFNQSALLSGHDNGTADSSFPVAAVIVPVLVLVGIVVLLGSIFIIYMYYKKIKEWMGRRFGEPRADIEMTTRKEQTVETADQRERDAVVSFIDPDSKDSQANTSFAPLLGTGDGDV